MCKGRSKYFGDVRSVTAGAMSVTANYFPSMSVHLSPRLVTGGVHSCCSYSFVSQVGHVAFLFICLPGLSLLLSALFVGHAAFLFIVCHCWCPAFSAGDATFLFICFQICYCWCLPFSPGHAACLFICFGGFVTGAAALFRWPCSISIHLSSM